MAAPFIICFANYSCKGWRNIHMQIYKYFALQKYLYRVNAIYKKIEVGFMKVNFQQPISIFFIKICIFLVKMLYKTEYIVYNTVKKHKILWFLGKNEVKNP